MSIRRKTLLTITGTLACLVLVLNAIAGFVLNSSTRKIEDRDTTKNVQRVQRALSEVVDGLNSKASDWSAWDDAYAFVRDGNRDFVDCNLSVSAFEGMRLDAILFIDTKGRAVYSQGYDVEAGRPTAVPADLSAALTQGSPLLQHSSAEDAKTGILMLSGGPLMLASRPIVKSDGGGPIRGTLIFARFLDDVEVKRLAEITQLHVSVKRLDGAPLPKDFREARRSIKNSKSVVVSALSETSVAGYVSVSDINGQPALIARAAVPREIHEQGKTTARYLMLGLLAAGLVFGVVTVVFLDRLVLRRLAALNQMAKTAMQQVGLQ